MDRMLESYINEYILNYKKVGYKCFRNKNVTSSDSSLLFLNSSMALFKVQMCEGDYIPKTVCVQDCFRNNNQPTSLSYFRMLGVTAMVDELYLSTALFFRYLEEICKLKNENLYCIAHYKDEDLKELWCKFGKSENLFLTDENDKQYSTRWTYGNQFPITGRGLTIVYENPNIVEGGDIMSDNGSSNKYIQFGNIIKVSNGKETYLDFGFGLERLISCKYNNDIFSIPYFKQFIDELQKNELSHEESRIFLNYIRSVEKLLQNGIDYSAKKEGYVLRSLTRNMTNILIDHINTLNYSLINEYFITIYTGLCKINPDLSAEKQILIEKEISRYCEMIEKNMKSAEGFLKKNASLEINEKQRILKERYGLPQVAISQIIGG